MTFNPSTTSTSSSAQLTYTISNMLSGAINATSLDFTHNFAPGLEVYDTPNVSTTCTGGTLTAVPGTSTVSYSGGSVSAASSCTISLLVSSDRAASFHETTGDLTSSVGNSGSASAGLTVTDFTAPRVASITRFDPAAFTTNADRLVWRISFNEPINPSSVSADDFVLNGTTATLSVNAIDATTFELIASGGDLAELDGSVFFNLNIPSTIEDLSGNVLVTRNSLGVEENSYNVRNDVTAPFLTAFERFNPSSETTAADELVFRITFNEVVRNVTEQNFLITGTTATGVLSGGTVQDNRDFRATSLAVTPAQGDGVLMGQEPMPGERPAARQGDEFFLTVSGGDLAELEGVVGLNLRTLRKEALSVSPSDGELGPILIGEPIFLFRGIQDEAGNGLNETEPPTDETYTLSQASPVLASVTRRTPTSELTNADTLQWAFAFTGISDGFSLLPANFDLTGTTATLAVERDGDSFNVTASGGDLADLNGAVSIALKLPVSDGGKAVPSATPTGANENSYTLDNTAPGVTVSLPGAETTGPFTATFTFSKPVTGFELADITVANGVPSDLSGSGDTYTATITPQAPGDVTVSVAEGAAADDTGLTNLAASAVIEAVSDGAGVEVVLTSDTADPGTVVASVNISNPGSEPLPFVASVDVPWIDINPTTGTISPLGEFNISFSLNDGVDELTPGDYLGTVTVTVGTAPAASAGLSGGADGQPVQAGQGADNPLAAQLSAGTILVELPINVEIQQRFGTLALVTTTPSGLSGDESFAYSSTVPAFDGLTLATAGGRASADAGTLIFGSYTLTQASPPGWRVDSFSCAGDTDGGTTFNASSNTATIDIDPGESLVCTYQNVRDEDAIRLATQRAIRGFMVRRADRVIESSPDLSRRFNERDSVQRGGMSADVTGMGRYQMNFAASLSGIRNAAADEEANSQARFGPGETPFLDGWDIWLAAEASGVEDDRAGEKAESDFAVVQLGVDYLLREDLIIGAIAQYDWMDETSGEVFTNAGAVSGAQVYGEGWLAGPYAVWSLQDTLVFDGLAMYGQSDNKVNPLGLYSDDFDTDRLLLRASLTGEFISGPWRLRPQATVTHYEERQDAYTDSLGIAIPGQDITLGRLRAGPELVWHNASPGGGWVELSAGVDAVWDYEAAELLSEAGRLVGAGEDVRADARVGFTAQLKSGPLVRFELGMAGLGVGDFEARTGRLEIRVPFGAEGFASAAGLAAGSAMGLASDCRGPRYGMGAAMQGGQSCDMAFR